MYQPPSPDGEEDPELAEKDHRHRQQEQEQRIEEAVDLRLRLRRLTMNDVATQTDPELGRDDIDHLQVLVPTAGAVVAFVLRSAIPAHTGGHGR